jgi:hypothetical protein
MVHEVLDEQTIEVDGMSCPTLAHAIQDGTRNMGEYGADGT